MSDTFNPADVIARLQGFSEARAMGGDVEGTHVATVAIVTIRSLMAAHQEAIKRIPKEPEKPPLTVVPDERAV